MVAAGRPSLVKTLAVWMNGERVGSWSWGTNRGHQFTYALEWLDHPLARPLSLSLPLAHGTRPFTGPEVEACFDNLLPDSPSIRKRLAGCHGAGSTHVFALLEKLGRDCVGAVQLLAPDAGAPDVFHIDAHPLREADIERLLERTTSADLPGPPDELDDLRISIAGAQEKTALLWHDGQWCHPHGATPTTHILKLPMGEVGGMRADFSTSVENEWLCARIATAFGLPTAGCEILHFGRHKVLSVQRFDRTLIDNTWWARLPQEDFCQALGLPPEHKYEDKGGPGMRQILDVLRGSDRARSDRELFLTAQLVFWLLAAPDGHAKNFSLFIEAGGHYRLTPLYDIMSAWPVVGTGPRQMQWPKVKMAMAVVSKNRHYRMADIQRRHWNAVARSNAIGNDFEAGIERIVALAPGVIAQVAANLPADFPESVSKPIFEGVLSQVARLG